MSSAFQIMNIIALIVPLFGVCFIFYALWRIMKSTKAIEQSINAIEQKIK